MSRKLRSLLNLEALEDRCLLTVVPLGELTEGNAADWQTFASDGASANVSNDITKVASGLQSLRFDTLSGFDTGVRLPSGNDTWDITSFKQLAFWTCSVNDTPIGFQGNQPVVVLSSATGSYRYTPTNQDMLNHGWQKHHIPLSGDAYWQRQTIGTPDLANINAVEIHQDTWDYGFTIFYDGMQFSTRATSEAPVAGPAAPTGAIPGSVTPRILLYAFNPIMENLGGQRLNTAYGWQDPVTLTQQSIADLTASSHGMYRPQIVETVIADQQPYFTDGFQHTDSSFVQAWANRDFHAGFMFDYNRFIRENDLAGRVDRGEIDEVWIYAPPIAGLWESSMAGNGAYWINGPTQAAGNRAFPIMGLNYERGVGEAIHSFGHRAESSVSHAYESISSDPNNNWRKFTRLDKDAPGQGGVGNVHFPVNGTGDYDYDNSRTVQSNAADWYNYPNLTGAKQSVNARTWSPNHQDSQREYLNWWYDHLPHVAGRNADYRLNNWWQYIGNVDAFKNTGRSLYGTDGTGRAWITGVNDGATLSGMVSIGGDSLIDGVVGRMDLYVDGVYQSSDDIGPFNFNLDTNRWSAGSHSIEVRAYEVQNQTETRSAIVNVQMQGGTSINHAPKLSTTSVTLPSILEDVLSATGVSVLQLVQSAGISDADLADQLGIAITSAPQSGGKWQYSQNAGSTWSNLENLSDSNARLLAADGNNTMVRFTPNRDFFGDVSFAYRGWDRSSGTPGGLASTLNYSNESAFSASKANAVMTIVAVNDSPVIQLAKPTLSIKRNGSVTFTNAQAITVSDVDAGNSLIRVTVSVQGGSSRGTLKISSRGSLNSVSGNNTSSMTLTGTVSSINAALQRITFKAKSGYRGAAFLNILANDLGASGQGGAKSSTSQMRINIG